MSLPLVLVAAVGRKTWASIGRPLPGRYPIVVSRDAALALPEGAVRASDPEAALARAEALAAEHDASAVMLIGGATLYAAMIARADRLELTEVDLAPEADAFFPAVDPALWRESARFPQVPTEKDEAGYSFVTYRRR
ncbi:MAG: dihydrofolate reductase [Parafilimonas terrae]|nr:dihydrofolate reductase [Parafilimonas terrae]